MLWEVCYNVKKEGASKTFESDKIGDWGRWVEDGTTGDEPCVMCVVGRERISSPILLGG
jgi:hypothetical protein